MSYVSPNFQPMNLNKYFKPFGCLIYLVLCFKHSFSPTLVMLCTFKARLFIIVQILTKMAYFAPN